MPEQHLHDADVDALLQESGREAVAEGVGYEVVIETAGVDKSETAAVDGLLDRGDQAAAVRIASNIGKASAVGLADFFLVSSGQS